MSSALSQPPWQRRIFVYKHKDTVRRVSDHLLMEAGWLQTLKSWLVLLLVLLPILLVPPGELH